MGGSSLEFIVMIGVVWNAVLQTIWFGYELKYGGKKHASKEM